MSANNALRLIARIADERARRARTPRRGTATYFPGTPPPTFEGNQGSPAEMDVTSVIPSLNEPFGGYFPLRTVGGAIIHDWQSEDPEIGVRFGQPQPRIQPKSASILELMNSVFASGGMTPPTGE